MSFFSILEKVASVATSVIGDVLESSPVEISLRYMNVLNEYSSKMSLHEKHTLRNAFHLYDKYAPLKDDYKKATDEYTSASREIIQAKELINEKKRQILKMYKEFDLEKYNELLMLSNANSDSLFEKIMSYCDELKSNNRIGSFLISIVTLRQTIESLMHNIQEKNNVTVRLKEIRDERKKSYNLSKKEFLDAAKELKSFGDTYIKKQ